MQKTRGLEKQEERRRSDVRNEETNKEREGEEKPEKDRVGREENNENGGTRGQRKCSNRGEEGRKLEKNKQLQHSGARTEKKK